MTPPLRKSGRATAKPRALKGRHLPSQIRRRAPLLGWHWLTQPPTRTPLGRTLRVRGKEKRPGERAGKRLTPAEIKRSIAQAQENPKSKTPIRWDAACHIGCLRQSCPHSHEPLPPTQKLDYAVAMQVLRRGGLKNGPKVNPKDVDGRIAQLRSQQRAEVAEKAAEGKSKVKAKAKAKLVGWSLGPVTALEHDLGELALGPDYGWHEAFRTAQFVDTRPLAGDEPEKRTACYEALRDGGELDPVNDKSAYLRSHVASRLANARLSGDLSLSVEDILRNAVDHGHPHLAEEAHSALQAQSPLPDKAGRNEPGPEAKLSETSWAGEVPFVDYRDQLDLEFPESESDWFHEPNSVETRQCLALHAGAALEVGEERTTAAARLRLEMLKESVNAFGRLGDAPPYVSEAEAFIRHNANDAPPREGRIVRPSVYAWGSAFGAPSLPSRAS